MLYEYNAVIERVVDGDTLLLNIDLGFNVWIKERIRLARINCPEGTKTELGKPAFDFTKQFEGQTVQIKSSKIDRYGRYVADVSVLYPFGTTEVKNLSDIIVENGFAVYVNY